VSTLVPVPSYFVGIFNFIRYAASHSPLRSPLSAAIHLPAAYPFFFLIVLLLQMEPSSSPLSNRSKLPFVPTHLQVIEYSPSSFSIFQQQRYTAPTPCLRIRSSSLLIQLLHYRHPWMAIGCGCRSPSPCVWCIVGYDFYPNTWCFSPLVFLRFFLHFLSFKPPPHSFRFPFPFVG